MSIFADGVAAYVLDVETYPNLFLIGMLDFQTDKVKQWSNVIGIGEPLDAGRDWYHASASRPAPLRREGRKIGRNELCPCGSGRKYKRCCAPGAPTMSARCLRQTRDHAARRTIVETEWIGRRPGRDDGSSGTGGFVTTVPTQPQGTRNRQKTRRGNHLSKLNSKHVASRLTLMRPCSAMVVRFVTLGRVGTGFERHRSSHIRIGDCLLSQSTQPHQPPNRATTRLRG